mmetsp:Transcript_9437/g.12239  ORF Transcript_9437/g.12239 Transcript_9437/m.12239 type:complete len:83 (-) Transcript_9437:72-320(-)
MKRTSSKLCDTAVSRAEVNACSIQKIGKILLPEFIMSFTNVLVSRAFQIQERVYMVEVNNFRIISPSVVTDEFTMKKEESNV